VVAPLASTGVGPCRWPPPVRNLADGLRLVVARLRHNLIPEKAEIQMVISTDNRHFPYINPSN